MNKKLLSVTLATLMIGCPFAGAMNNFKDIPSKQVTTLDIGEMNKEQLLELLAILNFEFCDIYLELVNLEILKGNFVDINKAFCKFFKKSITKGWGSTDGTAYLNAANYTSKELLTEILAITNEINVTKNKISAKPEDTESFSFK